MRALTLVTALLAASLLTVGLVNASRSAHQDDDSKSGATDLAAMTQAEKDALRTKVMQLANPGPEHELLARYVGSFDTETTMWLRPGAEPTVVHSQAQHELILGGRFLSITGKTVYEIGGVSFEVEALQLLGFNRRNERYTSVDFDTMGTYSTSSEGTYDAASKTVTLSGVDEDATLGLTTVFDIVLQFIDDDTMKASMVYHDSFGPGPHTMMEVVSRRRKE